MLATASCMLLDPDTSTPTSSSVVVQMAGMISAKFHRFPINIHQLLKGITLSGIIVQIMNGT
jgi:hypothetical protein